MHFGICGVPVCFLDLYLYSGWKVHCVESLDVKRYTICIYIHVLWDEDYRLNDEYRATLTAIMMSSEGDLNK